MAPVKFDDLPKASNEVLNDDYQVSGFQFQGKQQTSHHDAVITTVVDLFPGKDGHQTPAKLTWKFPKPFGCPQFCIDKFELDKSGGLKLEMSSDKVGVDGLKLDCKTDLKSADGVTASAHFTGIQDTQLKFETKALNPQAFTFEVTRAQGSAQFGLKCTSANLTAPDIGLRLIQGPLFGSLTAKEKFKVFTASGMYKASDVLKVAASYEYGGKKSGSFSLGLLYEVMKGTQVKAKFQQDQSVSVGVKHVVSKGFTVLTSGKVGSDGGLSYGIKLSIE